MFIADDIKQRSPCTNSRFLLINWKKLTGYLLYICCSIEHVLVSYTFLACQKIRENNARKNPGKDLTLHTDKDTHSVVRQEWTPRTLIRFSAPRNMVGEVLFLICHVVAFPLLPPNFFWEFLLTSDTLPIYPIHELFILILCLPLWVFPVGNHVSYQLFILFVFLLYLQQTISS